jgi:hypothetical protein
MQTTLSLKKTTLAILTLVLFIALLNLSCKKKKTTDKLYKDATSSDLIFYKNKDTIYPPAGGSPHGSFKLKFNSTAMSKFDASGRLPQGATFDNGSVIVKEVYSGGSLSLYAVMKKDPDSKFSSNGWLWAEFGTDGKDIFSISKKGDGCVSCHKATPNRDLARSFDLH